MSIDIHDPEETLFEKIMAHFGWYKVKKVEVPVENLDISYTFTVKNEKPAVKRPAVKRPARKTARTNQTLKGKVKNGN
jgi:hypothetical protein